MTRALSTTSSLLALAACGASSHPVPTGDAAAASERDGQVAISDGGRGSTGEPPALDAGDAEAEEVRWEPMPGLPDFCTVDRAANPEAVFRVEWEAFQFRGRDVPGVEAMVEPGYYPTGGIAGTGFHDGTRGYFAVYRWADPYVQVVFVTSDGLTPGAFRHGEFTVEGPRCTMEPVVVDRGASGFGLLSYEDDILDRQHRVYRGPREDLTAIGEPVAIFDASTDRHRHSLRDLAFSQEATAVLLDSRFVARIDDEGIWYFSALESQGAPMPLLSVVGRDVFWADYEPPYRVAHASPDGEVELFLEAIDGSDVWGFRTDGVSSLWTEGGTSTLGWAKRPGKLWMASYTTEPAEVVPVQVADMDKAYRGTWGDGLLAIAVDWNDLLVYDLDDGSLRRFTPHRSLWGDLHQPLYVTRNEIVVMARVDHDDNTRVFRLHLDELEWEP